MTVDKERPSGARRIEIIGTVGHTTIPAEVVLEETQDGAFVTMSSSRVHLDGDGLALFAREVTEWFMDDPAELVGDIKNAVTDLKEQLTDYNAKADEMGGDFEPFASMWNAAEAIDHRIDELAKIFNAIGVRDVK